MFCMQESEGLKVCGFTSMNLVFLSFCVCECGCLSRWGETVCRSECSHHYGVGRILIEESGGVSAGDLSPLGQQAHITLL